MDYHSDRFADSSLMILRKGRIYALLPANRVGDTLHSHQGLTYGGLLTDAKATAEGVMEAFGTLNEWLRNEGVRRVTYKAMPWIYHRLAAEEDLYALTQVCHARLLTREISSTILLQQLLRFTESRKSGLRKALREGLYMEESGDLSAFWQMLDDNLASRHHTCCKGGFPSRYTYTLYIIRRKNRWEEHGSSTLDRWSTRNISPRRRREKRMVHSTCSSTN